MKKHSFMSIISLLLVICLSLSIVPITAFAEENNSTSRLEDLIAGISSVEDIYGELDRETVPEIIGYDYAVSKAHVQRLYGAEDDDLNRVVFLNADGTQTAYIFDFPVKYIDEKGAIKDITLDIADSSTPGQFETAGGSSVTTFSRNASDGIGLVGNDTVLSLIPHIPVTRSGAALSSSTKITASSMAKRIDNKTISYDYDSKTTSGNENVSYLAGWFGDVTLTNNGTTSFGNDDYMADLDAENLFRDIDGGDDSITAINAYYKSLAGSSTRATIFKTHLSYSTVESMVLSELGKTLNQVKSAYPDTYDFLMSLKDGLSEIDHY